MASSDDPLEAIQPARPARDTGRHIQAAAPLEGTSAEPAPTSIQKEHLLLATRPESDARATFLIGREFRAPKSLSGCGLIFAFLALAIGILVLLLGVFNMSGVVVAYSVFFLFVALVCWLVRPAYRVSFGEYALQTYRPRQTLEYQEIMQVYAPERVGNEPGQFDIYLLHAYGYLLIPRTLQIDSQIIYEFLQGQTLAVRENPPAPPQMLTYLRREVAAHGSDQIHVYRSHLQLQKPYSGRRLEYVTGSMFFGGLAGVFLLVFVLMALGNDAKPSPENPILMGAMALLSCTMILGGFGYIVASFNRWLGEVRLWLQTETVMIVSPGGLALLHGRKSIILSWNELRRADVRLEISEDGARPKLTVCKEGVRIRVRDNLQWPLRHAIAQIHGSAFPGAWA